MGLGAPEIRDPSPNLGVGTPNIKDPSPSAPKIRDPSPSLGVDTLNIGDPSPNNYSVIILAQNYRTDYRTRSFYFLDLLPNIENCEPSDRL